MLPRRRMPSSAAAEPGAPQGASPWADTFLGQAEQQVFVPTARWPRRWASWFANWNTLRALANSQIGRAYRKDTRIMTATNSERRRTKLIFPGGPGDSIPRVHGMPPRQVQRRVRRALATTARRQSW
jgi:hypothetical protein